jgi:hypothetical protein
MDTDHQGPAVKDLKKLTLKIYLSAGGEGDTTALMIPCDYNLPFGDTR